MSHGRSRSDALLAIPVADLTGPLLPRQHGTADDFTIEIDAGSHGRRSVGRIMVVSRATGSDRGAWFWSIVGPAAPEAGVALSGEAGSLEEARLAFRGAFDRLIAWAASTPSAALPWHVPAERSTIDR